MACRAVHFAIPSNVVDKLLTAKGDEEVLEIVVENVEEQWDEDWLHQTDKSWDAMHRCLTNGRLDVGGSWNPLGAAVLGGIQLHKNDSWIISLVRPEQVAEVANALASINEMEMRKRYDRIDAADYDGEIGEDDWEYTWSYFQGLPGLFQKAAESGRGIVFSVDQ